MLKDRQVFGWVMYDWANSAFVTTVTVAVLPIFFADVIVGEAGLAIGRVNFSATALWAWTIALSALLVFILGPVLGAVADFSGSRKKFLMTFCYTGCLATLLLVFTGPGDVWLVMGLFLIAEIGFIGGNIFYDSFLTQVAPKGKLDWVSGKGYAFGYIGGGLQFAFALVLISFHSSFGISQSLAARLAMASAGLWWGGFAVITFLLVKEAPTNARLPQAYKNRPKPFAYMSVGFSRIWVTAQKVGKFKHLVLFLISFMIYNDGIQTVIVMATIYGRRELGFSPTDLMLTLLIIQFVAFFGSLLFGKLGEVLSSKTALMISLALWSVVVIYAYFMTKPSEYYLLGVIVGMIMGGSQALSRSLYGSMIPAEASAEFFGFYSVFSKFSAIWGPLVFGLIDTLTGSSRNAILSLVLFFLTGIILLAFVNVKKASEAKDSIVFAFEAS